MENNTSRSKYLPLHPFDAIYTVAFMLLMLNFLTKAVAHVDHDISWEIIFYRIVISLFLFFQLMRMYYHLKNFEFEISKEGNNHFLEIIPEKKQTWEKFVRILLAIILIIFSISIEFLDKDFLDKDFLDKFPICILFTCFLFLIIWDLVVLSGMKSVFLDFNL